ncbi:phenylalanine--tRNA ligase, mitochondrial-like isoform X2 [Watersipora subatra]
MQRISSATLYAYLQPSLSHTMHGHRLFFIRYFASQHRCRKSESIELVNKSYPTDDTTNITPNIISKLGKDLHNRKHHPINLIRQRIQEFFYRNYVGRTGNPLFAVFDNISPIVTLTQNFDNHLVPADHPSRHPKDSYYINRHYMLRSQTTCHTSDLIASGLDRFITVGDVYRRDTIDRTHYPVFHQMDVTRLYNSEELFQGSQHGLQLFDHSERDQHKQGVHSVDAVQLLSIDLKETLSSLALSLFGKDVKYRWVDCYFPFTHPSWELEIEYDGEWMEVLGAGILEQQILTNSGASAKVGWAFGLGLERLAMKLYNIPDVRLFWSEDAGFLSQFKVNDCHTPISYKKISKYPALAQDISFWLDDPEAYSSNDFYDLTRSVGGDLVEHVEIIDTFVHPKTGRTSHAYRVTYRHMNRNLTTEEINCVQEELRNRVEEESLGIVRK